MRFIVLIGCFCALIYMLLDNPVDTYAIATKQLQRTPVARTKYATPQLDVEAIRTNIAAARNNGGVNLQPTSLPSHRLTPPRNLRPADGTEWSAQNSRTVITLVRALLAISFWRGVFSWFRKKPDTATIQMNSVTGEVSGTRKPFFRQLLSFLKWFGRGTSNLVKRLIVYFWKLGENDVHKLIHLEWRFYNVFQL